MQIKKNPRDDGYPEAGDYEDTQSARQAYDTSGDTVSRTRSREAGEATDTPAREVAPARAESVLDAESSFDGRYEAGQDLRILGSISGEIFCRGVLTIERDATAKARIQARDAQIRGKVEGDVVCTGRLLLTATAVVSGTFKAAMLVVEEGASVSGTVQTSASPTLSEIGPTPLAAVATDKEPSADAAGTTDPAPARSAASGRWTSRTREVPSFALVSSEERNADRN